MTIQYLNLGLIEYRKAWDIQKSLHEKRVKGEISDTLILCEHPAVFTLGRQDCKSDILLPDEMLKKRGIEVVQSDRGGRVTYHGPGQLVAYFVFDVNPYGVKDFVGKVAHAIEMMLRSYGIDTQWNDEHPGLWVKKNDKLTGKIAAVGFHIQHDISMHGAAVNISPNMEHFQYIIPCGIKGGSVTSLHNELNERTPSMEDVGARLLACIGEEFGANSPPS